MRDITKSPDTVISPEFGITQGNWDDPAHLALGQLSMHKVFKTVALEPGETACPLSYAALALDIDGLSFTDPLRPGQTISGEQLLNRRIFNDGLLIMHRGQVLHESYRNGMTEDDRHVIHSCTKSLCAMLLAMAIDEGLLNPEQDMSRYVPGLAQHDAWAGVSLQHVMDMQAGIEYSEEYSDPTAHYWRYARAAGYYPPLPGESAIGAKAWVLDNLDTRAEVPGSNFNYNSCLTIVLGMALENVYQHGLAELFEEKLYRHIGAEAEAYFNTDPLGFPIVEGQLNLRLRDFARFAYPVIAEGKTLAGRRLFPADFIDRTVAPDPQAQAAYQRKGRDSIFPNGQYRNQFWVLEPEATQFAMLGIHGQFAWFDRERELMLVGVGSFPEQDGLLLMQSLSLLWQRVVLELG